MAIELIPLCRVHATLAEPIALVGSPVGTRLIFEVIEARFEGQRLRGRMVGSAGADWLLMSPEGTGMLDVRVTLITDEGALVFVQYNGRTDLSGGTDAPAPVYVAPRFETGDQRYTWLNSVQAIGKGHVSGREITYEWFEVR